MTAAATTRGRGNPLLSLSGQGRVWILTAAVMATAVAIYTTTTSGLDSVDEPVHIHWLVLTLIFYVVEVFVVHLHFRQNAYSFSLSEVPLILGLFFTGPAGLLVAQIVGSALALKFHRKQSMVKAAFNVSALSLEASLAALIFYSLIGSKNPIGMDGWLATFPAILAWALTQYVLIGLAISLADGRLQLATILQGIGVGMTVTVTNACLALVGVTMLWREPSSGWLLLVPMATLFFAYRAYTNERQKHESIESLYETTRLAHGSLKVEEAMRTLLSQTREMFRADMAMITIFPSDPTDPFLRTRLSPDGFSFMQKIALQPTEGVWARVASESHAVLVARPIQNERLREYFSEQGIKDCMVAPLYEGERIFGVMHVCNRLGDVSTFDLEDLTLFETLANHASVSLENARLVAQLEESLAHLTEMNRLKDDFVASVSHELRTPLTSIRGYVKTLLRPDATFSADEQRSFLETVDRQSNRLHRLIEDLLAVSRIESETDSTSFTVVSPKELVAEIADELRAKSTDHTLVVDLPSDLPVVTTDPGKVHQIILNLIDNALKYAPRQTTITVSGVKQAGGITVSVADQGEGIPLGAQESIFERFYQVDQSTTRAVGGTGLGLYICRRMAEAIGGRVWLEKSDEEGSTFSLWIPTQIPLPHPLAVLSN